LREALIPAFPVFDGAALNDCVRQAKSVVCCLD
jgi:hypothetical protein